jgi:hypothetical protein
LFFQTSPEILFFDEKNQQVPNQKRFCDAENPPTLNRPMTGSGDWWSMQ